MAVDSKGNLVAVVISASAEPIHETSRASTVKRGA